MKMFHTKTHILLTVTTVLFLVLPRCLSSKGCSFQHEGCTYNIHLHHKYGSSSSSSNSDIGNNNDDDDGSNSKDCGNKDKQVFLDRAQNDYTAKIDDIEKSFSFLRDAHETRIKELESTVRDLLGLDNNNVLPSTDQDGGLEVTKKIAISMNNDKLMTRLEEEFEKLRKALREKSTELIDTTIKLNETSQQAHDARLQHFQTSQDLLNAENQITMLKRERAVLKNQLKDRSYKLDLSHSRVDDCELKSSEQQEKMMKLLRSENVLSEELMTAQLKLNLTQKELGLLDERHSTLKERHERVRRVMKIREEELMLCYLAKTSTFCGFEDPKMCGFTNINDTSDFFNWERARGYTPSARTGPSKDHTCDTSTGHFMYIEASAKGRGNNAILYSPLYRGLSEQCVEFFYHMNGRHIGTLNVYAQTRGDMLKSVWRAYGNQGDVWTNARLAIPKELAMSGYQIAFEGITENGYQGDIAIDDVSVTDGPCPLDAMKVKPTKVAVNSTQVLREGRTFGRKLRKKLKRIGFRNSDDPS